MKANVFSFKQQHTLPLVLLLPLAFAVGLWIGSSVLPGPALAAIYNGSAAIASLFGRAETVSAEDVYPAGTLLSSGGLPLAAAGVDGSENAVDVGSQLPSGEENILILPPKDEEVAETGAETDELVPQVAIYCTHATEEYAGQTRVNGEPGGVIEVASALAAAFEERGVGVIFVDTLHDSPSYDDAYYCSQQTVESIAAQYPDIEVYIDVHRDSALAGVSTTVNSGGTDYAKMLLIVGSNENLPHPNWQQNNAFAEAVTAAANELIDGIMRAPRIYSGRYNQHVAVKAILVEFGSTDNTVEQAKASAAVLAEAVISCMK